MDLDNLQDNSNRSVLNPHPSQIPGPNLFHQLVHPPSGSTALEHLENGFRTSYTYGDLHLASDRIAAQITAATSPSSFGEQQQLDQNIVPVLIHQSPLLYAALLGTLKSGGAFCPLNIDAPPERVSFILQDVSAKVILVSEELVSKVPDGCSATVIVVTWNDNNNITGHNELFPGPARVPTPDDLAYVMYTSGSTGTPKGVGIPHSSATQALLAHDRHMPQFSRFLQFAAPTFDVSVFEIFFPLFRGNTLVSVSRGELLNDLPGAIREMDIDACELTPSVAGSLLRSRDKVPCLKLLLTIGEMLNEPVVREFGGKGPGLSMLWAMYGPTEATIHCTLEPAMAAAATVNTIGVPLDTVSCYVIRPASEHHGPGECSVLPRGEIGELAVGGFQLAVGYLNRPEQTAASFINSPYGRLYRTGDKARITQSGKLECFGRLSDGQVKLRGQRLELGEVESAVLRMPGCHGAVAMVESSILICFCAVDGGVTEDQLLDSCKRWLPQYMVPGELIVMDDFPRLPSGKANKKQLLQDFINLREAQPAAESQLDGVSDELAIKVSDIVSKVLGRPAKADDSFSAAGLDSLAAIRLASSLREAGFEVVTVDLLKLRTVSQLASLIRNTSSNPAVSVQPTASASSLLARCDEICSENPALQDVRGLIEDIWPCIPLQAAMLAESSLHDGAYWNKVELETDPHVTVGQVLSAFRQVAQSNEIIRTGFSSWRGGFASVLFMGLQPGQVRIVDEFEHSLPSEMSQHFLQTIHWQVRRRRGPGHGVQMLVHVHHAIYDGWSLDMLLSDMTAILKGLEPPVRPQFRDVAPFYMHPPVESMNNARKFWTGHLLGWNKVPFPKLIGQQGGPNVTQVCRAMLEAPTAGFVESSAQELGCSAQVLFQAALALMWNGITGSSDIVLGTVTSGRAIPVPGIHSVMGPCVASMPLRVNLERMTENAHLLNHIHSSNRAMMEHYSLPLAEVKRLSGVQPGDTIYDILFAYQESPESGRRREMAIRESKHLDRLETKFVLEVEPREEGFALQATYHSDSFDEQMVVRMLDQFKFILQRIIKYPQGSAASAKNSILDGLATYNKPPSAYEGVPDLAAMFEAVVEKTPNAEAICFAISIGSDSVVSEKVTYRELNEFSNKIAHSIRDAGAQTGEVVAIVMEKSIRLYASILAIVKAGCAYLPLLPSTPASRVREIFSQADTKLCLVDADSEVSLALATSVQTLAVGGDSFEGLPEQNLNILHDGSRLSYVIYTSGTTGKPKGVAVTQLNAASNIGYLETLYPKSATGQSRLLQACSQAFDVSVFEIFYTWHAGMCLCSGTNDTLFEDLENAINQLGITHLSLTPTVASLIDPKKTPNVEFLVTAGEAMTSSVRDTWGELLWQGYGPSETTNICTVKHMKREYYPEHLGWVFPNTSVFVLSPQSLDTLPTGWVGEFCFGGDQVAQGYLNLPEVTAASFIEHPKYGRIYRSGDMGRMLPDGSLIILGRMDGQLKLRGQRIEAGEINSIITATDLSSAAVTLLARQRADFPEQLVTFFVHTETHKDEGSILPNDAETTKLLFLTLQARLPSYMVPSYLIRISGVPKTTSGKIDIRKLRDWFQELSADYLSSSTQDQSESTDGEEASQSELLLKQSISEYLGIPESTVGRWTPFANLGIDSISAIGLARALKVSVGRSIPVSAILRNPNLVLLGRHLDSQSANTKNRSLPKPGDFFLESFLSGVRKSFESEGKKVENILPCTPLQEAMLAGGQQSYYNKVMLRLLTKPEDMRQYWNNVAARNGILRTAFVATDQVKNPIAQVVLQDWEIPWLEFSVSTPSFDHVVDEHLKQLPEPVDSRIPPISLAVINYRGTAFLSFICHHALYDGVAMVNLWREVEALANGAVLPPPVPYEPFLMEVLSPPSDTDSFWLSQLRDFQSISLFRRSKGKKAVQAAASTSLNVPLRDIHEHVQSLGVSFLSLCEAAWANTIAIASSSTDVCFGNVVSGRTVDIEGIEKLIAPCFNTIPIRKDLSAEPHGINLVKDFYELNSEILSYQFTPLRQIQKTTGRSGRALFDTLLIVQQPLHAMDDSVWILEGDNSDMDIPLVCEVVPCPSLNTVVVNIQYDMDAVSEAMVWAFAGIFRLQFESILKSPYGKLLQRSSVPPKLIAGLEGIVVRRERVETDKTRAQVVEEWPEVEAQIRNVLVELSGQPASRVSRFTSIFQLGLDSINAVQVASMLRRQGLDVSASDVIECTTCAKISERVHENNSKKTSKKSTYDLGKFGSGVASQLQEKLPADRVVEATLPCTPMQEAMLMSFIHSDGSNYFNSLSYEIEKGTSTADIVRSWATLTKCHPLLRTAFLPVNHHDCSFAMVRYSPESSPAPLTIMDSKAENLESKMAERRAAVLSTPSLPPWHVFIEEKGESLSMVIMIHHAIYDAQSLDSILAELAVQLKSDVAFCSFAEVEPSLAEMMMESNSNQVEAEKFWKSKGESAVVNTFPIMTPLREPASDLQVESMQSSMSFSAFQAAAQSAGVSVQAVFQAAWTRILSSYLGENSVTFGVILSSRSTETTRDAPMPCLSTVPVVAANQSCNAELLKQMMEFNSKCHKFQSVPLSQVQKWLGHPASPVFDTLLSYRKVEAQRPRPFRLIEDKATVEYPVSIEIEAVGNEQMNLSITYLPNVVPLEQAKMILRQFDAGMCHLIMDTNGTHFDLYKANQTIFSVSPPLKPEMPSPVQYMHEFVEMRARSQPDAIALEFVSAIADDGTPHKQQWTYRELDEMGNRVANMLAKEAAIGSIIGIHFVKCPEAYFAILGILKAGCSFVALDPTAPSARKEFIMSDSQAPCVLTGAADLDLNLPTKMIPLTMEGLSVFAPTPRQLGPEFSPSSTCYCLYTSGTTGTPKGCEITHENAVQAMMAFQELFQGHWEQDSRWLQFAALHFDVSVLEQYWSWSVGISVVSAPKDLILDDLTGTINKLGITHIDLTPSLARLTHPDEVPSLCRGVFITGGESLKQEILDVWGPKAVIYNAYGPTEATIGVTMYQRVPINGRPSNIGRQFSNVGSYVFHPGTEIPVLRGGVGELCVSGKLVGKGYLGRAELTQERFPTLKESGERIYRTGDLVRILCDGCFDFLGRADDQVKLRGQRLEIGEINHAIRSVPDISDAATIVTSHGSNNDKTVLVSFVVSSQADSGDTELKVLDDVEELSLKAKEACRQRLPGYMVPTYCLVLPYIPLSVNNKAEAKELKRIFRELSHEQLMAHTASPTVPQSGLISDLCQKIIKALEEFGSVESSDLSANTSVFDVGVDSITALRLSSILKSQGLKGASTTMILRNPVVADLARALSSAATQSQEKYVREAKQTLSASRHRYRAIACRQLGIRADEIEYIAPCSPLQQGIISKSITNDTEGAYFNSFELKIRGKISQEKLRAAWDNLVGAETILRTVFLSTTGGHVQVALKKKAISWISQDLPSETEVSPFLEQQRQDWIKENSEHIANPLKFIYVTTPAGRSLFVNIFHGIYDGNSLGLMLQHVASRCLDVQPTKGPSFLEALIHGPLWKFDHCRQYWVDFLKEWASPRPLALSEPASGDGFAVTATRSMSYEALEQIRKTEKVTLQAVMLALWTSVLQPYYYGDSMTLGMVVSGRSIDLPSVDQVIGPLFNTLPFTNKSLRGDSWSSLIQKCHKFGVDTLPFQHVPLQKIQKWCSKGRPLFDTLFTLQLEGGEAIEGPVPWEIVDSQSTPDYPLAIEINCLQNGKMNITLVAQGSVANTTGLESILDQIEKNMGLLAGDSKQGIVTGLEERNLSQSEGLSSIPSDEDGEDLSNFSWDDTAIAIKEEAVILAGTGVADVTESTTMFELGLDSIDVIKLSAKLRKRGVKIPASSILRLQSIAKIATAQKGEDGEPNDPATQGVDMAAIKKTLWDNLRSSSQEVSVDLELVEDVLPPTALQESMVAAMISSGFEWYFNHDLMEIQDGIAVDQLRRAWALVAQACPILRTGFYELHNFELDFSYCQVVRSQTDTQMEEIILDSLEDVHVVTEKARSRAEQGRGLDHLFQLTFITVKGRNYLLLSVAHALYDGWSLGLIYQLLRKAYDGESLSPGSPENFISKAMMVQGRESSEFWGDYLQDATPTLLANSLEDEGKVVRRTSSQSTSSVTDIQKFCQKYSVSLQVLCQACWAVVLAHETKQLDVTFGVVMSGREFEGAEDLVFPTMNTVALRCILHDSAGNFVQYLEENMGDIRNFQGFPLRKAQQAAGVDGQLFDTLFMLQKSVSTGSSDDLVKSVEGSSAIDYPFCIEAELVDDALIWRAAYQPHALSDEVALSKIDEVNRVMNFIISTPESDLLSFDDAGTSMCGLPSTHLDAEGGTPEEEAEGLTGDAEVWDETSSIIRSVLSEASGVAVDQIRLSNSLYHLGLDSIIAIKVSAMLRRQSVTISVRDLIRAVDIRQMAASATKSTTAPSQKPTEQNEWHPSSGIDVDGLLSEHQIEKSDIEALLPAIPMQVFMLSTWQNSQGRVFYPEFSYSLKSSCSLEDIHAAWGSVVTSTSILRTRFIATLSKDVPILQVILRATANSENPWVKLGVKRAESEDGWLLRLKIHHALYDGVSLPAIMQKLSRNIQEPGVSRDDEGLSAWSNFAITQTLQANKDSRRQFWTDYLQDCKSVHSSDASIYSLERTSVVRRSALPDVSQLRQHAAQAGVSVQSLFLAAYARTLASRQTETHNSQLVMFGVYLANRDDENSALEIFPQLNLLPLKVAVNSSDSIVQLAAKVQTSIIEVTSQGRSQVGLWEIEAWTGVKVDSFVNFLSLPTPADDPATATTINPVEEMAQPASTAEVEGRFDGQLGNVSVRDAFPAAIDIEAAIRGEILDVGAFGAKSVLADEPTAEALLGEILTFLQQA
ncbi:unnamed protein product [Clonostachys solani]|uniref:Carrier domain-containing protein n=1 Tax=Clonostachys solani TaxID=160281 RepID=A0A9P0EL02_9HYPO|nr:unnamed protein product [Clonostachys solani]